MRTRLVNLLLVAALLYGASRLWQVLSQPPPALPPIEVAAAPAAAEAPESEAQEAAADQGPEGYEVIVARDLFSPSRGVVPPAPVSAGGAGGAAQPPVKALPLPKLTLFGVVIVDSEKAAFIQEGTQEGRPRKVREKDAFAGGIISAIRPDGVTFLFAGSEVIVPLRTPKELPSLPAQDAGAAAPQPKAPATYPRRVTQPAPGRISMPPGSTQNRLQPAVTRGPVPPGLTQGQIPAVLTPPQTGPVLSPFSPEAGEGEGADEDTPQEAPYEGGAQDPSLEEENQ